AKQVSELHALLASANNRVAEFETRAVADRDSHHQLQVRLDSIVEERDALARKLQDTERSHQAAKAHAAQLERKVSELQALQQQVEIEKSNLADKVSELSHEIQRLRS